MPSMNQRTKPVTLILLAIVGAAIAWVLEIWIVGSGWPMFVPPLTMPITLAVVAVVLLVLAWPVRAYTRALRRQRDARDERRKRAGDDDEFAGSGAGGAGAGSSDGTRGVGDQRRGNGPDARVDEAAPKRVDPVYAVRVLAFAKASSLAGSVLAGGSAGVFVFVLTRPVIAQGLLPESIAGVVGAVVLLVAGLVAESWCLLPPDSRDARHAAAPSRPVLGA